VTKTDVHFPDAGGLLASINRCTRKDENAYLDALGLAETLFDDHMAANLIVLGAAYQAGAIPVAASAIERAIALNGVSVTMNTQAFRAGRLTVADPSWVGTLKRHRIGAVETPTTLTAEARALVDTVGAGGETRRLLEVRVPELIDYQDAAYARRYVDIVRRVVEAERRVAPDRTALSEAVARYLFKLMAYKDEYEVARLHLKNDLVTALKEEYPDGVTIQYNLHPPLLRAFGWQRKIRFGRWFDGVFRMLYGMRGVRGGPLDVFGWPEVRRVERALIDEYVALVDKALAGLDAGSYDKAARLAALPDIIRGYEDIKLANVRRFRDEVRALGY
jgi:indolepyruvate ferredoxin oxidoreductase